MNNYFEVNNRILTQSKIKDFVKDKQYFYQKHILGEIKQFITDPLIIGSAIDCWLTEGKKEFENNYYMPQSKNGNVRRDTNAKDYEYQLTERMDAEIRAICTKVEQQPIYKEIMKNYECQKQLYIEDNGLGGYFDKLGGIPDWLKTDTKNKKAYIIDYKTASAISPYKYFYMCRDYGYFIQQAMYQMLVYMLYPEVKTIESWHLVTEKDSNGIYKSAIFQLSQEEIEKEVVNLQHIIYEQIAIEKKFSSQQLTWEDAELIGKVEEMDFINI